MENFSIVYGIKKFDGSVGFYYPEAFVANVKNGRPFKITNIANEDVINSYGFDVKNTIHAKLLALCYELSPSSLESRLQKDKRKKQSLLQLFNSDDTIKNILLKRIDLGMTKFIEIVRTNEIDLYFEIERKINLSEIQIFFSDISVIPILKFEKTVTGTNYILKLKVNDQMVAPVSLPIEILVNNPALILQDKHIYNVENINGQKLQPFLTKEKIFIPSRLTKQYFTTYIKDIVGSVDVVAEGFDFSILNLKPECVIKFSRGFYNNNFEVMPFFYYDQVKFQYGDKAVNRVNVVVEEEDISVVQINRDLAFESKMMASLFQLNYQITPANRLIVEDEEDLFESILRIVTNEQQLKKDGWTIEYPKINDKVLNVLPAKIEETVVKQNDWFDIYALVMVGDQIVKFASIIEYIKNGERIFPLPDDTCFIIPIEWFSKYTPLVKFGELDGDLIKVKKSHFTILEGFGIDATGNAKDQVFEDQDFEFEMPVKVQAYLRPYQTDGVKWLINHYKNKLGACLADDMGLGKTLQTLTLLQYVKDDLSKDGEGVEMSHLPVQLNLFDAYVEKRKPLASLIVCPATLVYNWEREIKKFTPSLISKLHIGEGRATQANALKHFDIIITSYQTLLKDINIFESTQFQYMILDESHYIKNRDSQIFKTINKIKTYNRVSLSGTPIENSLSDLWSQMEFINPSILGSFPSFQKSFKDPIEKQNDADVMQELKSLLAPFILRRTKKDVLQDLPDVEEQFILSDMTDEQKSMSESEKSKARNMLLSTEFNQKMKFHVLAAILKLRQIANHPILVDAAYQGSSGKFEDVINSIDTILSGGNKILLFSSFVSHLNLIEQYLIEQKISYTRLTGEENGIEKKKAEEIFQTDKDCCIMLITVKAGGVGLNLTAANYVMILDPWWNPYPEEQAIARAHRLGQNQKVTVIRFVSKDSIEEKIMKMQSRKVALVESFMDFDSNPILDDETVMELLT